MFYFKRTNSLLFWAIHKLLIKKVMAHICSVSEMLSKNYILKVLISCLIFFWGN